MKLWNFKCWLLGLRDLRDVFVLTDAPHRFQTNKKHLPIANNVYRSFIYKWCCNRRAMSLTHSLAWIRTWQNTPLMPLSHYDHESQESPRIDKFQDSWGFIRNTPITLRPRNPRISKNWQFSGFVVDSLSVREVPTSFVYIRSDRFVVNQGLHESPNDLRISTNA